MKKNPIGAILVLIAAVVAALGVFLPFYKVDALGQELTVSLINADGVNIFGVIILVFLGLTLIFALAGVKVAELIFGIITALLMFLGYFLNNAALKEYEAYSEYIDKGVGNTLCLVGAILVLVTSIIYIATTKSAKKDA